MAAAAQFNLGRMYQDKLNEIPQENIAKLVEIYEDKLEMHKRHERLDQEIRELIAGFPDH